LTSEQVEEVVSSWTFDKWIFEPVS
jgi:hypothetical protein